MKHRKEWLFWTPRILCIIAIIFVSLFALDSFSPELTLIQQITAFIIHLIPSFILIIILFLSWKKEFIGGLIFILIGLVFSPIIYVHNYKMNESVWMSLGIILSLCFPFILVGILFLLGHFRAKRRNAKK